MQLARLVTCSQLSGFRSEQYIPVAPKFMHDWLHANEGPVHAKSKKHTGSHTAKCVLICLGQSQRHAEVPVVAVDADQAIFTCPESVPRRAATTRRQIFRTFALHAWQLVCDDHQPVD
eukprot:1470210-Pleurochrysis_carterae.AAC.2